MPFVDANYKEPTSSSYMRFEEGANTFRILSEQPVEGWEYWKDIVTDDGKESVKPIRKRKGEAINPNDLRVDKKTGKPEKPKFFWAMIVYNRQAEKIQLLSITQVGVRKMIADLTRNPKWGDPIHYDITVTKTGNGFDTEYTVVPEPKEPLEKSILSEFKSTPINMDALFDGGDVFSEDILGSLPDIDSDEFAKFATDKGGDE